MSRFYYVSLVDDFLQVDSVLAPADLVVSEEGITLGDRCVPPWELFDSEDRAAREATLLSRDTGIPIAGT